MGNLQISKLNNKQPLVTCSGSYADYNAAKIEQELREGLANGTKRFESIQGASPSLVTNTQTKYGSYTSAILVTDIEKNSGCKINPDSIQRWLRVKSL